MDSVAPIPYEERVLSTIADGLARPSEMSCKFGISETTPPQAVPERCTNIIQLLADDTVEPDLQTREQTSRPPFRGLGEMDHA